jgi:hypothetical protein
VGLRAGLDWRKISSPPGFDPGPSSRQSVAIPTELPGPLVSQYQTEYYSVYPGWKLLGGDDSVWELIDRSLYPSILLSLLRQVHSLSTQRDLLLPLSIYPILSFA